jgi:hypothetical protein
MGILGDFINLVANFISAIASVVPGINPDAGGQLATSINNLNKLLAKANAIFPLDTVGQVLSLLIGVYIALIIYYTVCRVINLLRGAG